MKNSASRFAAFFLTALSMSLCFTNSSFGQTIKQQKQNAKESAIKMMIDSQRFIFDAQSATTMGGRTRQLTYGYNLIIKKDSIEAYLPYFGVAYTATIGSSDDGGIKFKTADFEYTIKDAKKGGWDILIKPKNIDDASQITISISTAGYTTVQVNSNNRGMISFYGSVRAIKH